MKVDVGYCIYLPTEYDQNKSKKYPVVYYLHGGRVGFEMLKGFKRIKSAHKRALYSSSIQSALFNILLSRRIEAKQSLMPGDILKKLIPEVSLLMMV